MRKTPVFIVLIAVLIIFGTSFSAWAVQLSARINPETNSAPIEIKFQRTIFIEYEQGGQIADELRNKSWLSQVSADISSPGVVDLMNRINQKIARDGSGARLSDLNVDYSAKLTGRGLSATIDYKLILDGELSDYLIRERQGQTPALVDAGWRGISVDGPVVIDGIEINIPISAIKENEPNVYSKIV